MQLNVRSVHTNFYEEKERFYNIVQLLTIRADYVQDC